MCVVTRALCALLGFVIVWMALALIYATGLSPVALFVGAIGALTLRKAAHKE